MRRRKTLMQVHWPPTGIDLAPHVRPTRSGDEHERDSFPEDPGGTGCAIGRPAVRQGRVRRARNLRHHVHAYLRGSAAGFRNVHL